MFCPLCQAEYREGFAECSDCHVSLIASFQDAQDSAILLWDGYRQGVLDKVLAALQALDIPSHFKEEHEPPGEGPLGLHRLLPLPLRLLRASTQLRPHYKVWVLKGDIDKARSTIAALL